MSQQDRLRQRIVDDEYGRLLGDALREMKHDAEILFFAQRDARYELDRCKSVAMASYRVLGEILAKFGMMEGDDAEQPPA